MKPYLSQLNNVMMIINEANLISILCIFYAFVELQSNQKIADYYESICLILVMFNISINMTVLFILKLKTVYLVS